MGYCGADIKALCTEAALLALRRRYPQIYTSDKKLLLDVDSIEITARDFDKAMQLIVPASQRSAASPARVLPSVVRPLLAPAFHSILDKLKTLFPPVQLKSGTQSLAAAVYMRCSFVCSFDRSIVCSFIPFFFRHSFARSSHLKISSQRCSFDRSFAP